MTEPTVLVLAEHDGDSLRSISLELLGAARRIADDLGHGVKVVAFGAGATAAAKEAILYGADAGFAAEDAALDEYYSDSWASALSDVINQLEPSVVLIGQTAVGRDLAPRIAIRAGTAVAMDCIALEVAEGRLAMTRPSFGGKAHARYTSKTMPQIATVRAKSQAPAQRDASRSGTVDAIELKLAPSVIRILAREMSDSDGPRLEDAKVVVSGGRGLGSAEAFSELGALARVLNGSIGSSRAAVDLGWAPVSSQVGLTGKVVTPDLYIAIGISGASQHIAGMTGARTVVGVNTDPNAEIFKYARFGIVADWKRFLPAFTEACRNLLKP